VAEVLEQGKSVISRPGIGATSKAPGFVIVVPIRDAKGKVIGALGGTIRVDRPSFLDKISENKYGDTGGYLLLTPVQRVIIAATDRTRILEQLPLPGVDPVIDTLLSGEEGTKLFVNPRGVEVLASGKRVPLVGWIVAVSVPTKEAFAPIAQMQTRFFAATAALVLLAGLLTWWMLRRELAPMSHAVKTLASLRLTERPLETLLVNREDEIGDLINAFNQLLVTLDQREAALRESKQHLSSIIDADPQCIKIVDPQGILRQINAAGLMMLDANSIAQLVNQPLVEMIAPEYRSAFTDLHHRVIAGETVKLTFEIQGLLGRRRWVETHAMPLQYQGETMQLAITRDVTEGRQNEEALRIAAFAFDSKLGMVVTDEGRTILRVNKAFTQITGYSATEAVGRTPRILASGRHDVQFYTELNRKLERDGAWQGEVWNRRKNGEIYPVWLSITAVRDRDGNITNYVGSHHDITEQKNVADALAQLNQDLAHSRADLRAMASQKEVQLEQEKKHIAREVHDELGQFLTALRMNLSACAKDHDGLSPTLSTELMEMKRLVDRVIVGVRNVASNLRPAALDMGLWSALEWLANEFSKRAAIPCVATVRPEDLEIDEAIAVVLFRIAQESLTNITRHAQATEVGIYLQQQGDSLHLEVRDNGRGFLVESPTAEKTFGLLGMRERSLALGGTFKIDSSPGLGTVVNVWVPLSSGTGKGDIG
jgi:PAS domain S-box-containing protein